MFRAYFTDGQDIGNRQTLIVVVSEAGMDQKAVAAMLNTDAGMYVIANAKEMSDQHGVTGVPFLIIHQKVALSGAQAPETFIDAFKRISA